MIALVALGGGLGAMARYGVDLMLGGRLTARGLPGWALALINISGSLLIGFLAGLVARGALAPQLHTVLATGFLGGYTTFSAASLDVVETAERGGRAAGMRRALGVPVAAVAACAIGLFLSAA